MYFQFTTSTELVRIPIDAVVYIAADGNYSSIRMVDNSIYVLTLQLGQIEKRISETVKNNDNRFVRIGKSLIVNRQFITTINPYRQKLILADGRTFRHELSAAKEALKNLKDLFEKEATK
ncbi:MAG: LytTR family transcriptional regulator [Muribaculaceae bacterium]|nr:LytTR family transcriptional regulator [Muribaculaceae bacterium]